MDIVITAIKIIAIIGLHILRKRGPEPQIQSTRNPLQSELKFFWEHQAGQLEWHNVQNMDDAFRRSVGFDCTLNSLVYTEFLAIAPRLDTGKILCFAPSQRPKQVIIFDNSSLSSHSPSETTLVHCECHIVRHITGVTVAMKNFFIAKKSNSSHYYHFDAVGPIDNVTDDLTNAYKVTQDHIFAPSVVNDFKEYLQIIEV